MSKTNQPAKKRTKRQDEKLRDKYVESIVKPQEPARKRKDASRKQGAEPKTPSALSVDERAFAQLVPDFAPEAPLSTMPARAEQTLETLGMRGTSSTRDDATRMAVEPPPSAQSTDVRQELFRINAHMHAQMARPVAPLEELVQLGLISSQLETLDQRQDALAAQCNRCAVDTAFVASQLNQLHRQGDKPVLHLSSDATPRPPESRRRRRPATSDGDEGGMAKLTLVYGTLTHTLQYRKNKDWELDHDQRMAHFFRHDQLDTQYRVAPHRYSMLRQLALDNMQRYKQRATQLKQAAQGPLRDLVTVCREEMLVYRRRPLGGEPLCVQGQRCCFYTFSQDPAVRYVGRVFRGNQERLCIDCLLRQWTLRHAKNIAQKVELREPYNWFTVQVGPGQYAQRCMLECSFDGRPTGIVGCVPRYDPKQRELVVTQERRLDGDSVVVVTDSYVGETGTDF